MHLCWLSKRRWIEGDGLGPSNSILIVRSVYATWTASHIGGGRSVEPQASATPGSSEMRASQHQGDSRGMETTKLNKLGSEAHGCKYQRCRPARVGGEQGEVRCRICGYLGCDALAIAFLGVVCALCCSMTTDNLEADDGLGSTGATTESVGGTANSGRGNVSYDTEQRRIAYHTLRNYKIHDPEYATRLPVISFRTERGLCTPICLAKWWVGCTERG